MFVEIGMSGMLLNLSGGQKEFIVELIDFILEFFLSFIEFIIGLLKFEFEGSFLLEDFIVLVFELCGPIGSWGIFYFLLFDGTS